MPRLAILIVAAGKGVRAGAAQPKQYARLLGKPMLRWTLEAFADYPDALIQVMVGPDQTDLYEQAVAGLNLRPVGFGGATRQETVRRGLELLEPEAPDYVLIHDAARPFVSKSLIDGVIDALEAGADGAVPHVPVSDTLRKLENGKWVTVPREGLLRAQTPQGFRFAPILKAHRDRADEEVTDDTALAELDGLKIVATLGETNNMKVTTPEDFTTAQIFLAARLGDTRTATGFDVHKFGPGDHIWLGGIKIPHTEGLVGHSDADVALHALTDALLGTIADGDIGMHFPPTDERWRGATSSIFLDHAAGLLRAKGGTIVHVDVTVICERPKVGPHREAMRAKIAEILKLELSRVSVKATTTEGLGFTGRREGIAAEAIATVRLP
ncbi:bifunctional 2-C-methyl-D-erythritol 4-phosphate cytidylyltransferase/2-C-methyl-D-erythritol 2,4-cyclodiphosphate synthase [Rhizomicrobium electricum]|uniref:Bifunctional enzyme IspD/IspF n=1 Tax=Rhizomicrobium electricum TaxID=480070 RepID=A0ABN1F059_9PROT|nr:bifunctional 2-C-methyl-D-erythritol 4-phosphate cytidylyltransferase/2-C-methyl-D-erythritol 2,4-cyclodiphosphate synthase [Rhizomicrobium electricum]NIJ50164.1 2-C-methyl-D-erythritol 4-phosphate cytidylyltransferase/2-C-methyl-D-erythritol 2,4-cyclodiphosphate synthase [Rhizomicrobium electricum]